MPADLIQRIGIVLRRKRFIAPSGKGLDVLKEELDTLKNKNWQKIHK